MTRKLVHIKSMGNRVKTHSINVVHATVKNDLCIGCGLCAGVCPTNRLTMNWSEHGSLIPMGGYDCPSSCDICLRVCPFSDHDISQHHIAKRSYDLTADIKFQDETGYHLSCFAGYSLKPDQRARGASGGMLTWFLETILERGLVDKVACVIDDNNPRTDRLFRFGILSNVSDIRAAAKSKYYPVDISEIIKAILKEKDEYRYAVVGLPCTIFGLNLAMLCLPKLQRRVAFKLSMVCGQLPTRFYTEFLVLKAGVPIRSQRKVEYRLKQGTTRAGNYGFRALGANGKSGPIIYWEQLPNHLWQNRYFMHNACNFCDDVFGETADAVFMDAWLPEYEPDPKGHSLIIARTPNVVDIFNNGRTGGSCHLEAIDIARIIRSQAEGIWNKKQLIKGRLFRAARLKQHVPRKRMEADAKVYYKNFYRINLHARIMRESRTTWAKVRDDGKIKRFWSLMEPWEKRIKLLNCIQSLLNKAGCLRNYVAKKILSFIST